MGKIINRRKSYVLTLTNTHRLDRRNSSRLCHLPRAQVEQSFSYKILTGKSITFIFLYSAGSVLRIVEIAFPLNALFYPAVSSFNGRLQMKAAPIIHRLTKDLLSISER